MNGESTIELIKDCEFLICCFSFLPSSYLTLTPDPEDFRNEQKQAEQTLA